MEAWRANKFGESVFWTPGRDVWPYIQDRIAEGPDGCIDWTGTKSEGGYPCIKHDHKTFLLHRVVLAQKLGRDLLPEHNALHTCDRPSCINPEHLWEGTQVENIRDMDRKQRRFSILRPADVVDIKTSNETARSLAARYNVSMGHISSLRSGRRGRTFAA